MPDPAAYGFPIGFTATQQQKDARAAALGFVYDKFGEPLDTSMESVLEAVGVLEGIDYGSYVPGGGAQYPMTNFGGQLRKVAQLAQEVPALEVAHVDVGGWDTHDTQGVHVAGGRMYDLMDDLARSLKAFHLDMASGGREFVLVVVTEFGRKVVENSSAGTDHGRGGVTIVSGSRVVGGRVYTTWPGLAAGQLDQGDVAVTTDVRDVFGEIVSSALANPDNVDVVVPPEPGAYQYAPIGFLS